MERKLASIQKILSIEPIEGADAIEKVKVQGWQTVAKKGEFQIGQSIIFFEIDSVLDKTNSYFAFLEKTNYRLKTCKLRRVLSQGLAVPISIFKGYKSQKFEVVEGEKILNRETGDVFTPPEGFDMTELTKTEKWEPPIPAQLTGQMAGLRPSFVPKTDETRIQSCPKVLDEINNKLVYITVKLDGSSFSAYFKDGKFGVCSRNYEYKLEDDKNAFVSWAKRVDLEKRMREYGKNIAIQGELVGPGIQKNLLNLKEFDVRFFNVYDIGDAQYMWCDGFVETITALGLKTVPIEQINVSTHYFTIDNLLEMAKGKYEGTNNDREGIVIRPMMETYSEELGGRLSFKVINNDFLLKGGD